MPPILPPDPGTPIVTGTSSLSIKAVPAPVIAQLSAGLYVDFNAADVLRNAVAIETGDGRRYRLIEQYGRISVELIPPPTPPP